MTHFLMVFPAVLGYFIYAQDISLKYDPDSFKNSYRSNSGIIINHIKEAPVIDGKIKENCWKTATSISNFYRADEEMPITAEVQTAAYICYDDKYLYIACHCNEPYSEKIKENIKKHDENVYADDCMEIFIKPTASENYYQITVNPLGVIADAVIKKDNTIKDVDQRRNVNWESEAKAAANVGKNSWEMEIAIPLQSLNFGISDIWKFNIARTRRTEKFTEYTTYSKLHISFHQPEKFSSLTFRKNNYTIENILTPDFLRGYNRIGFEIKNEDNTTRDINICINKNCLRTRIEKGEKKEIFPEIELKENSPIEIKIKSSEKNTSAEYFTTYMNIPPLPEPIIITPKDKFIFKGKKPEFKLKLGYSEEEIVRNKLTLQIKICRDTREILSKEFDIPSHILYICVDSNGMPEGKYRIEAEVKKNGRRLASKYINLYIIEGT